MSNIFSIYDEIIYILYILKYIILRIYFTMWNKPINFTQWMNERRLYVWENKKKIISEKKYVYSLKLFVKTSLA